MTAWLLIVLVWAVLFVFWKMLGVVFDCFEKASADRRSREAMSPIREREQSDSR